jgi:tRNA-specific 2-thiouridylase
MCNRLIKFGAFHEKCGKDYDLIATGHYATTEEEECSETVNGNHTLKWLCTSPDPVKDQTDFLAQIYDWQLKKALFPIGHMMKEEVREIAEREHLVNAKRKDSQGICFLGKINYNDYLRRYLGEKPGDVIEMETGKKIGKHKGHWFHTIGQRKGMGLGGGPWFVIKKDIEQNIIYVSHGYDPESAYTKDFPIHDFHSINGQLPPTDITLKIRHTPDYLPAILESLGDGKYLVHADAPIHGVAPGQFCVIYDAQHHRCYGSGEITI